MKKYFICLVLIPVSCFVIFSISYANPGVNLPSIPSATPNNSSSERLSWISRAALDFYFDLNIWRKADAGYVAIFAKDGKVIHATAKGMADIDNRIAMNTGTRFRIASMTKPITAIATLILIEEGKLSLYDPIEKFIPSAAKIRVAVQAEQMLDGKLVTEPLKRPITVFDLLTFSSGAGYSDSVDNKGLSRLSHLWAESDIYKGSGSLEQRVNKIMRLPFFEQPGKIWRYGWSTDILARVVEVASKESFGDFLNKKIFLPLEMNETNFFSDENKDNHIAEVYARNGLFNLTLVENPRSNPVDWTPGSSGLISNAEDYIKFALMLWNEGEYNGQRIVSPDSIALMRQPHIQSGVLSTQVDGMGFGFGVGVVMDSEKTILLDRTEDFFWSGFYGTNFFVSPQSGLVAVIMSQNQPPPASPWPGSYGVFIAPAFAFLGI
jgi:CubicO group peptidase (beta-lactamase class C family)